LLVNPEVFGIKSGDLAEFCDYFADNGFFVVLPDWHSGDFFKSFPSEMSVFVEWAKKWTWDKLQATADKVVLPIFAKAGVKKIACAGFCYGTWVSSKLASKGLVHCVLNFHPSHTHLAGMHSEDPQKLIEASKATAVLQFPAGNDPDATKPGGSEEKFFKQKLGDKNVLFKEFKEMAHGWASRGDASKTGVREAQTEAWQLAYTFVCSHL